MGTRPPSANQDSTLEETAVVMVGFPPPLDSRPTLENWQVAPYNRWSYQHLREMVPTARISRGSGQVRPLRAGDSVDLSTTVRRTAGTTTSVSAVLDDSYTDGFLLLHDGAVAVEHYADGLVDDRTHMLMSVSKSIIGCVAGVLLDRGDLKLQAPLTTYVSELFGSGYDGATVRHILDMRSGVVFSEAYLDPTAEVRQLDQVMGWTPRTRPDLPTSLYEFLATLTGTGQHGGPFEYRSSETDVLGWVCERATGVRMPEPLSELIWSRLGAEHDADAGIDAAGAIMHDGGLATTLRDLGRFGQLLLENGAVGDEQVIPADWIADSYEGDPDSRQAFANSPTDTRMPGGMYRNQFWIPYPDRRVLLCLGIHGQLVYVDPTRRVVAVKLSSWPVPQDAALLLDTLSAVDALAATWE